MEKYIYNWNKTHKTFWGSLTKKGIVPKEKEYKTPLRGMKEDLKKYFNFIFE